jgi:hypothetical protein
MTFVRLVAMGYGPESDLSHLHYYQLIGLPALDTPDGGDALEGIVKEAQASLVVLDTMARVVDGEENQADTYRDFYRYTGLRLKALDVALLRLDHSGKDLDRGQHGSSAKADDIDVVFQLCAADGGILLKRTHSRIRWVPAEVRLQREEQPVLAHLLGDGLIPPDVEATINELDHLRVPDDASGNSAVQALHVAGLGRRREVGLAAQKVRSGRS